jgi:hypothetical protein
MKTTFLLLHLIGFLSLQSCAWALTLTLNNYNHASTAIHGIADKDAVLVASSDQAGGVIGTMKTLSDTQIDAAVATGNLAAIDADFQVFDSTSGPFPLASFSTSGVVEASLSEDTRSTAAHSLGGKTIYVWLYKGNSRTTATQFFLAKLNPAYGTDPEDDVPLSGIVHRLRPENVARYYSGSVAIETHDYQLGGGAVAMFKMAAVNVVNRAPIVNDLTLRVQPGASRSGNLTASDPDGDSLFFNLANQPTKGKLNFNGTTGAFSYTADQGAEGQDSFSFTATDGSAVSNIGVVTINLGSFGLLTQTISFDAPAQRTVNSPSFSLFASASSELPVSFQIVSGPATLSGSTITLAKRIGIVVVQAIQPGDDTYSAASVQRSFFVTADARTLTLGHLNQVYQGIPLAVSIAGTPVGSTTTLQYRVGSGAFINTPPTNAGSYQVRATVVSGSTTTVLTGTFVITKAILTVTADDQSRLIGQANAPLTMRYSGFLGGDTRSSVFTRPASASVREPSITTSARNLSSGGVYPITLSGGVSLNYNLKLVSGKLTVRSFAGEYENLLSKFTASVPAAKVDLLVGSSVKIGLSGQPNTMTCSGKLWLPTEANSLSFAGTLSIDAVTEKISGSCSFTRRVGTITMVYRADVEVFADGRMSASAFVNNIKIGEGTEGRKIHVPATTPVISYAGDHTVIMDAPEPLSITANPMPRGIGHATAKISNFGIMTLAGRLGDGTSFTASLKPTLLASLAKLSYRLFSYPYVGRKDSSISAWLDLIPHPTVMGRSYIPNADQQKIFWTKNSRTSDVTYPLGIAASTCNVTLDPWQAPTAATRTLPATTLITRFALRSTGLFSVTHDTFTSPSLPDLPVGLRLTVTPSHRVWVVNPAANLTGWRISAINLKTGVFTGDFTLTKETPRPRRVTFTGVFRQPASTEVGTVRLGAAQFLLPSTVSTEKPTIGTIFFSK